MIAISLNIDSKSNNSVGFLYGQLIFYSQSIDMLFAIFFLSLIANFSSLQIREMDSLYQYSQESIVISEKAPSIFNAFRYGLWSKYNPLTNILQVGNVGMFDSDCFLLHSAVEELSLALNLIYYDCVDYSSKKVQKTIAFIDNDEVEHSFTITIDPLEYENVWYLFEIIQWPLLERFELRFIYKQETFNRFLNIKKPFKDENLKLIFGGGMIVTNSKIGIITPGTKFSYFPGKLIQIKFQFEDIPEDEDQELLARTSFKPFEQCDCQINDILTLDDISINRLENQFFTSQNTNCNSFQLSGWLKITDIIQNSDVFTYQLIALTSNFQNQLANKNLSPFTLSYKISQIKNQIIVTTYSYTFPSATISFSDDPFLITKELDLTNTLLLWQKLQVQLLDDQLIINVKFYEGHDIYEYNIQQQVNQFKCTQFKLQYGNILQSTANYFKIIVRNMGFNNCNAIDTLQICHYSCEECDGPTSNNCLSCSIESQRIYLPDFKACVCPFDTIDEKKCKSYTDLKFKVSDKRKVMPKCNYGYFEYEDSCLRCPTIINDQFVICLECIQNPQGWSKNSQCEYDLYISKNGEVANQKWRGTLIYYTFDGDELLLCNRCSKKSPFLAEEQEIQQILGQQYLSFQCQFLFDYCSRCWISVDGFECLVCFYGFNLIDNHCVSKVKIPDDVKYCPTSSYVTHQRKCKLCPILHCKYCFEYQDHDLSKCTLYIGFGDFDIDNEIKIGCALCEDNYIFDFEIGICIQDTPKIQNCLRSYIYDGQEICTLSSIDDFSVALEIINCHTHLPHCEQCVLSPQYTIKCIVCQVGYSASIQNGGCYLADEFGVYGGKIVIDAVFELKDGWVQRIQSFMMKFLPNKYFYFQAKFDNWLLQMIVECQDNYFLGQYFQCHKKCDSSCLECIVDGSDLQFCNKCPLNYYQQPIRDQINGICSGCSQLCQACTSRTDAEIKAHQPNFIINGNNFIHTKKCLKQLQIPNIYMDPYDQTTKYCFDETCSKMLEYNFDIYYCEWFNIFLEEEIDINYLNAIGIDSLVLSFNFTTFANSCTIQNLEMNTKLKSKVFSLNYIHFIYTSREGLIMKYIDFLYFNNIDKIEINQIIHETYEQFQVLMENNHQQIQLYLSNFIIQDSQIQDIVSVFQSEKFGDVIMNNVYLLNTSFINSSFLNLTDYMLQGTIQIDTFVIRNCTMLNSNFFQITNNQLILSIKNVLIEDSDFTNVFIYFFDFNVFQSSTVDVYNITVKNSKFVNSSLFNFQNYITLYLRYLQLESNTLISTNFIISNHNTSLSYIKIQNNEFVESQLITMLERTENKSMVVLLNQIEASNNQFENSKCFKLFTNQEFSQIDLTISNLIFNEISSIDSSDTRSYLFQIKALKLKIQNVDFRNLKNIFLFSIFDSNEILIQNVIYANSAQIYQVPFSQSCQVEINEKNQMLKIENFFTLKIVSVQIINQFAIDESFLDLSQRQQFEKPASLDLADLAFRGNVQIYKKSQRLLSLLALYSEWSLNVHINKIQFFENCFHSVPEIYFQSYASLVFMNIKSSDIEIFNFSSQSNAFTNSSNSFIFIEANTIKIQNLQVSNHNILTSELWERFYGLQLGVLLNQQQINQVVFQALNISNIGGVGQLKASVFTCLNCNFQNVLALRSFLFDITTLYQGIIKFINLIASDLIGDLKQETDSQGCISISCQDSSLELEISKSSFRNIYNRMSPSILSIQPSKIRNKIRLIDTSFEDCLSLMNSILLVQFSNKIYNKNTVELRNIMIVQQLNSWLKHFQQLGTLSLQELLLISSNQNSLLNIESSSILIFNISIQGVYLSPIFKIVNTPKLKINQVWIKEIKLFYSFTLINIQQMLDIQTIVLFEHVNIFSTSIYEAKLQRVEISDFDFVLNDCVVVTTLEKKFQENQLFYYLNDILTIMEEHNEDQLSLINIYTLSSKHTFYFNKLELVNNNCLYCTSGLIKFDLASFQSIKIQELICINNIIKQFGCINFLSEIQDSPAIQIFSSAFLFNRGTQGVAISSNKPIILKQCKTIQNIATYRGGGLYLELNSNQFIIENSVIIENQAEEGGGLYTIGNGVLNQHNLNKTYLLFNNASVYGNNLIVNPTHLALFINSQEMKVYEVDPEQIQTDVLRITPYSTIQQEKLIETSYLMIPSGQSIEDFSLSMPKLQQTYQQIKTIEIMLKNSLKEFQKNIINSTCLISDKIVKMNGEKINGNLQNVSLLYQKEKSTFDLSSITFYFDPYEKDYRYLEISIICLKEGQINPLKYVIQAQSYKCQLGEFHVENGCQICQSNQGFYSVTYDVIKCSIFDKEKFLEITSNAIKLQEGYWRPNYLSDYSTLCFKKPSFCVGGWDIGDELCSKGHVGALCEECDIYNIRGDGQYLKNLQNSECLSCFGISDSILPFILNSIWQIYKYNIRAILSIILTVKSIVKSNDLFLFLKVKERFSQILFKLNQDRESILIKMFLNYLWIFSLIFTFNINFSFQFNFVDSASNTSLSMANNLDCYLSQIVGFQLIYSKIILILLLIFWQFVIIMIGLLVLPDILNSKLKISIVSNILLCLYIFNYAGFIKMLCSAVSYREISNIKYIQGDLTLKFNTETHYQWMYFLVLPGLIIFGCLIPLLLFLLMYFKRNGLDFYTLRPHICYLFNEYVSKRYYWEQIKLSNKALIILFLTYFETNTHLKASLIGLSLICYQQFAAKKKPYIIQTFNILDLEMSQKCSVSIFLAAVKYESEISNNKVISLVLQICLILLFFLITFPFIYQIGITNYKKYKILAFSSFHLVFKYFRFTKASKVFEQFLDEQSKKDQRLKENFTKLRKFLIVFSKAQIKNRPVILSRFNSSKNYQQTLLTTELQAQSVMLTANRLE
ncbi:unnamed protein product (macronuclear) [Paramecium tetraurelia]|uniref:Uncharacterized protein n=1 Tax=Paramecium tetraurelia TaxID=5888 RepID=A0CA29_PARTE|nr:uncharacterized protein GSPATT00036425001 [Paramecium tetraurelia]CAK67646.1 unnamed protein product [Paramecium tetraurelia]|eukprot:XP_001435043.1 hypothetical protein (macronuclear) [Paramecium tetraurelia strain d4-2]